jgi:4-hydroxy-3-methylbut-2-enyl diphosphate reductase
MEQRMPGWLPDRPVTIGLTAGASTPDSIVGAVVERILSLRGCFAGDLMRATAAEGTA